MPQNITVNFRPVRLVATSRLPLALGRYGSKGAVHDWQLPADSVEKVGFSARLNSDTTTPEEPTHHIEWFFGPSVTFAALLLG